ncbi:Sorbitol dehydrogenase [Corynebacterium occultum]|uniref:Sorbitol dehydrogenase n=1 Tax=Corynebacterium occultum TaxID=2675219 RepID=A0A6B8W0T2_9CORY|nr:SDR family oxidoreductase [Corynebacterium occultum]QGU06091.1 Sorbitol dehydrogenase [Corynebacterium occultum]
MPSIFISGAARGLGRAVAEKFLAEGWTVGAYDIAPITYEHPHLFSGILDVTDAASWEEALGEFATHSGGLIDVVDNNAGILIDGALSSLGPNAVARQIEVNCLGVTLGAQAAHPYLKKSKGQLVNMASASAIHGQPNIAVYSATKSYVGGLTEALGLEWRRDGIRVIDLWPLWARTGLAEVEAPSVRRLGVRITPEQVAQTLWRAVNYKNRWERGKVHHGVSTLDKALYLGRSLAPDRVARLLTRVIAG